MEKLRQELLEYFTEMLYRFGQQKWWPGDSEWEICVGAILTQNTNWGNVEKAITNLKQNNALDSINITNFKKNQLANLIKSSGYHNQKSVCLVSLAAYWNYNNGLTGINNISTENLRKQLISIKGIGEETADAMLLYAFNRIKFLVDEYTIRILERHKLIPINSKYAAVQELFEQNLSNDLYLFQEYHALLVKTGKEYCSKRNPKCTDCPLYKYLTE
jgi:endonuclease III related protein